MGGKESEDPRVAFLENVEANIVSHGWSMTSVFSDGESPPFSYSTGLARLGLPEILVFGLSPQNAGQLINIVGRMMRDDGVRFELETPYEEISAYPMIFRRLPDSAKAEYMRVTGTVCGPEFEALQMIWPDPKGCFPWEAGFDEHFRPHQTMLGEPEERH